MTEYIRKAPESLTITPIGFIRTESTTKFAARHQPQAGDQRRHVLELVRDKRYRAALKDLEGFSRIWLLWWFHRNTTWRPEVLPPRGPAQRRGVFATRSPHRPNPLGLTAVELLGIDKYTLHLGPCDAIEGTPVFDVRPYISAYDAFPNERGGWMDEVDRKLREPPPFTVVFSPLAKRQAEWLQSEWQVDFQPRVTELLGQDPSPHRTRRIKKNRIDCGAWRAFFEVHGNTVTITELATGYPLRVLEDPSYGDVPDGEAQLAFSRMSW